MDPPLQQQQQQQVHRDSPIDPMKTGIASKLMKLKLQIEGKQQEINSKQQQMDHFEQTLEESNQSLRQLLSLKDELLSLKDEQKSLKDELSSLKDSFTDGLYFAPLFDYWKLNIQNIEENRDLSGIKWTNFWRTADEADSIQVRENRDQQGISFSYSKPYKNTRQGAEKSSTHPVASDTARTSQHSQSSPPLRNLVWPIDIFGNSADLSQPIAHLLPAGQSHKEWTHIAASVVGLDKDGLPLDWIKAVRGFKINENTTTKRAPGSGVVHFVSNKIRMVNQGTLFDGPNANVILIPTMSLESAKAWKGEAYSALFAAGLPNTLGNKVGPGVPELYQQVGLTFSGAREKGVIRDASATEIENARKTLTHAILAVRDYLRNTKSEVRIQSFGIKNAKDVAGVKRSHEVAKSITYPLPEIDKEDKQRKPLCLVEFV
ncbi:hypothetical protein IV203_019018 [Nitzschia inconspicua]|uniref:Uncharacterized protein n=1 Tax=Nitzschia inconspicua TaxID=303405 RepID=A0A9K3LXK3_9STRA|nr:hypothetical protein IV203_022662 [Nitzschia inconspicua]KAG7370448.1 hypothetical protein IV203_019018 [Nitzschia inconspicua]